MVTVLVQHWVEDFTTWKAGYDRLLGLRQERAVVSDRVLTDAEDPNNVVVIHEFDTMEAAVEYVSRPDLRVFMRELGVVGEPRVEIYVDTD